MGIIPSENDGFVLAFFGFARLDERGFFGADALQ
jgi:hypothetical protein